MITFAGNYLHSSKTDSKFYGRTSTNFWLVAFLLLIFSLSTIMFLLVEELSYKQNLYFHVRKQWLCCFAVGYLYCNLYISSPKTFINKSLNSYGIFPRTYSMVVIHYLLRKYYFCGWIKMTMEISRFLLYSQSTQCHIVEYPTFFVVYFITISCSALLYWFVDKIIELQTELKDGLTISTLKLILQWYLSVRRFKK